MELKTYQKNAFKTCMPSCNNFSYMMLNLVGEVGELASKVAKAVRREDAHIGSIKTSKSGDGNLYFDNNSDIHLDAMKHEAGDVLWQIAGLCTVMGWSLEEIAQMNLDKLQSRQERGVISGDGDNR